ncbi:FecR domain-containing protein [Hymenobacter aerilatus]|uniref:FecR domain-containing protein n=1 Tax=Hymenobacter aerilatus TaxID=2932251 RepID=A0A8T9SPB9_9BACT|nr:FecR family protein [Hymenobacter aerilatus]UOR03902.1 FecR domain-containing protein [Hymenobacter aerilatus]
MSDEEFNILYEKHVAGTCTAAEQQRLDAYLATLETSTELPWDEATMGNQTATRRALLDQLTASRQPVRAITPRWQWWSMAAVVALLLLATGLYRWQQRPVNPVATASPTTPRPAPDFAPGRNQATLMLADGSTIRLDDAQNGIVAQQGGTTVQKTQAGALRYDANSQRAAAQFNTVTTPRGGQYQLVLPDGSRVWLNAASSLRFPTAFAGQERRVELTGEAYFEVAKNAKQPFKVGVGATEVTVLGTHFNVMAYPDEPALTTTLLEGAVRVSNGPHQAVLHPGQQARQQASGALAVAAVDPQHAVAWKNGYFVFNDESIESIMRQVSRWYDVDVEYQGKMAGKDFNGTVSRFQSASQVLQLLELTGAVHFKTQNNRITVLP